MRLTHGFYYISEVSELYYGPSDRRVSANVLVQSRMCADLDTFLLLFIRTSLDFQIFEKTTKELAQFFRRDLKTVTSGNKTSAVFNLPAAV